MQGKEDDALYVFNNMDKNGQPIYDNQWLKFGDNVNVTDLRTFNFNDVISAMWVHPRVEVDVCTDINYGGKCKVYYGSQVVPQGDLKSQGLDNSISSFYTRPMMSFNDWKLACCRNEVGPYTDSTKCGKYWSQDASVCGNMDCDTKLIGDAPCSTWCQKNPQQCDSLKLQFCAQNPTSPYCGCINDTPAAISQRSQYPMITGPRQCWSGSDCQKTDLYDTLITQSLRPTNCPDINAQIQQQNIVNSNITGSNISMSANSGSSPQNKNFGSSGSFYLIIFIIILIFIVLIVLITYAVDPKIFD